MAGCRLLAVVLALCAFTTGCATSPETQEDRSDLISRARSTTYWFEKNVSGLRLQVNHSAGYIVFPDVAQWGLGIGGGSFGRGVLFSPGGTAMDWAAINTGSVGLQAGVQGFRMMIVLENQRELEEFRTGKWNGSATGVAVAGQEGGSGAAPFQNGVAIYQGANQGLMAGVNVGLNNIRCEEMD